jgi:phosphonatase-like hydrolase
MGRVELCVLDMAGTTVRDDGLVLAAFMEAAAAVGLRATAEEVNARMGQNKREVLDALARRQLGAVAAAERLRDDAFDAFRRVLEAAIRQGGARPMPGAEALFGRLRASGVRVALNTGFYREVTELIVERLGWRAEVDAVVCGDDVPAGRPAPYMIHLAMQRCAVTSVHAVAVVGDTPSDLEAGTRSGARAVVGVTSGAHGAASLRRAPHTHLLPSVGELGPLLERIDRLAARVAPARA